MVNSWNLSINFRQTTFLTVCGCFFDSVCMLYKTFARSLLMSDTVPSLTRQRIGSHKLSLELCCIIFPNFNNFFSVSEISLP